MNNIPTSARGSIPQRIVRVLRAVCSKGAAALFAAAALSAVIHIALNFSVGFSDFFGSTVSAAVRAVLAAVTGLLPFSLAETIIITLPFAAVILVVCILTSGTGELTDWRIFVNLLSVLSLLYTLFVLGFAPGYTGTGLVERLSLEGYTDRISVDQLEATATILAERVNELADEVDYLTEGASVMPYSLDEMREKLRTAYNAAAEKYDFIPKMSAQVKFIALSEPMTYTHISGVYTYYTGEANLNINFPDYTLPFTAAHEMSHQRGIGRENEANFMAYLVCMESDDVYIRYSGELNMLEYVLDALYTADRDAYASLIQNKLSLPVRYEMNAYYEFFTPYRKTVVSEVSGAINDTYLKAQGQSAGTKSYGLVVNLAVAYFAPIVGAAE